MSELDEKRLNYYSKYNRVKERQEIDTLYTLLENNKAPEIHIVNVHVTRQERQKRPRFDFKRNYSKPVIPTHLLDKENDQKGRQEIEEINDKLDKLKKLQREFHQQIDRKQNSLKKKRQLKEQKRRQQEKYKERLINVMDVKHSSNPSSMKSSGLKSKKNDPAMQQVHVDSVELDFSDYYREAPEVPICSTYTSSTLIKKEIQQTRQSNKKKQKLLESVDEEGYHRTDSIILGRINLENQKNWNNSKQKQEPKIQLTHSQSLNIFTASQFDRQQSQDEKKEPFHQIIANEFKQYNFQEYSPARHLESVQNNIYFTSTDQQQQELVQQVIQALQQAQNDQKLYQDIIRGTELSANHLPLQQVKDIQQQPLKQQLSDNQEQNLPSIQIANNTGTDEGQSIKEEIQDRVGPIMNKSQFRHQNYNIGMQNSVFHSQTSPNSKFQEPRETKSIVSNSLDFHPLQPQSDSAAIQMKLQNKRSSFKRLMAQNRSNLIPRMAISTILNEHINEVLVDSKAIAQATPSPLHQSIVSSESPAYLNSPSKAKKVNFKQRIVEKQIDKSHSREVRPNFQRDQSKLQKNRGFLLNFFAQN